MSSERHLQCYASLAELIDNHGNIDSVSYDDATDRGGPLKIEIFFDKPSEAQKIVRSLKSVELTKEEAESIKQVVDGRTRDQSFHEWMPLPKTDSLVCHKCRYACSPYKLLPESRCPGKPV